MTRSGILAATVLLALATYGAARAADQLLAGTRLAMKLGKGVRLTIRDPHTTIPEPGSPEDPSIGAGLELQLYGHDSVGQLVEVAVPPGAGWRIVRGGTEYRYRNGSAPSGPSAVRALRFRAGKGIKLVVKSDPLALFGPQMSVGVLVTTGNDRLCTLFGPGSIRRDEPGLFVAGPTPPPSVTDCNDPALFGDSCGASATCGGRCPNPDEACAAPPLGGGCECISGSQPCGGTSPACNGTCGAGEACANIGGLPYPTCTCLPEGSTGCGGSPGSCGGDCPAGLACSTVVFNAGTFHFEGCGCRSGPPLPPCGGPCPPGTLCAGLPVFPTPGCYPTITCSIVSPSCPAGTACQAVTPGLAVCAPTPCGGGSGYPTCNGTCDPGLSCRGYVQGSGSCYCAP